MRHAVFQEDLSVFLQDGVYLITRLPIKIADLIMPTFLLQLLFFLFSQRQLQHEKQRLGKALVKFGKQRLQLFKADVGLDLSLIHI